MTHPKWYIVQLTYYTVTFGISDGNNINYFNGKLVIRMDADGKDYVYDVEKIRKSIGRSAADDNSSLPLYHSSFNDDNISHDAKEVNNDSIQFA